MTKDRPLVRKLLLVGIFLFFLLSVQSCFSYPDHDPVPILKYEVINIFPHDSNAFTQGLVWKDGFLYEGTGLYGSSSLRKVDFKTGKVLQQYNLPEDVFGEGITIFDDKIYQLTWREQTGFIYDLNTFQLLETFSYTHEGWGMTHDMEYLIISDGTPTLYFMDPFTLEEVKRIDVHHQQAPLKHINELEYIKGKIYANIWQTDQIAIIDPQSGKIIAWLDLSGILNPEDINQAIDVLNGIAYESESDMLFVTGKLWPKIFQIKIIE